MVTGDTHAKMTNVEFVDCCLTVTDGASATALRSSFKMDKGSGAGLSVLADAPSTIVRLIDCSISGAFEGVRVTGGHAAVLRVLSAWARTGRLCMLRVPVPAWPSARAP